MLRTKKQSTLIKVIVVILFAVSLIGFRMMWNSYFQYEKNQPVATAGELDLREWDFTTNGIVTLSGEWEFYPYLLFKDVLLENNQTMKRYIQAPGNWSTVLNNDKDNPYGYGTYHLRVQVEPELNKSFKLQVPSVRSASTLYVNDMRFGSSGEVGSDIQNSKARNAPYTSSTIRPDESGEINLFIEASNFVDPRSSGLVRSVKFGLEEDIVAENNLSTILQTVAAVIFFVHGLFAIIIYFIGIRDSRLLYFSIIVTGMAIINLTYGDEKVLFQYMELDYAHTLKGASLLMLLVFLALIQVMRKQMDNLSRYIVAILTPLYILLIVTLLFLPVGFMDSFINIISYLIFATFILSIIAFLRSTQQFFGSLAFALAIIAVMSHFSWFFYLMTTGLKVVHYPFDLIIAIVCIAVVWFKQYYDLHQESLALTKKLTMIDQTKDEFLANTSHELRNPLHSILNISDAVLQREKQSLQAESVSDLETILTVSKRMSSMVNELLDIAAIKDGLPKLNLHPVSIKAITSGVIDMVIYSTEGRPVKMINNLSDDLPYVQGDENRLIQIMFNLLHNAIKFTPEGKIVVDGEVKGDQVSISVMDTGVGMSEETVKQIFDRYVQGTNAEVITEGGFGIGLYICKQLIELHGGSLEVKSALGEGSAFTFSLPVAETKMLAASEEDHYTYLEEAAVSHVPHIAEEDIDVTDLTVIEDHPRIIVVDDERVNLRVIETVLTTNQYEITSVLSAAEALELLDEREWDLIITDVMMPEMSGYELTRKVRERFSLSELPVLLVTARSTSEDIKTGFAAGANDYIAKPIDAVELRSRVKALTSARQSMRKRLQIESAWLQAQIEPHFLFNTLNSIIALSQFDLERMTEMLNAFSDILRAKFKFDNLDELVPLHKEISLIESYVHIEQVRFGERLQVTLDIDEEINVMIPTLSIQPLIENAINHGVMSRDDGGEVLLRIQSFEDHIKVTVTDNGIGIEEDILEKIRNGVFTEESGVGLINIHLRLKRLFSEGLTIESTVDQGTTVSFNIPKR